MELLSTLSRIQRSRVLYTYGLVVDGGGRNDGNSNKLIQANVCAMNACKSDCNSYIAARMERHSKDSSFLPEQRANTIPSESNSFPLWNWASHDLSFPDPARPPSFLAMASHVFWNCPCARRHWNYLLERWRKLGDLTEADLHVWVFGMELPSIPKFAWDVIKNAIDPGVDLSRAKDAAFPATRELWRFLVSTTLYSIYIERLRRLEDATLAPEVHNARAKTQL